jgi:hypothetical protein
MGSTRGTSTKLVLSKGGTDRQAASAQWPRPFVNQYVEAAKMRLPAFANIIKPHQEI